MSRSPKRSPGANLRAPFPRGVSGNPGGRPLGVRDRRAIGRDLRELLAQEGIGDADLGALLRRTLTRERDGRVLRWVLEMLHGRPRQQVDVGLGQVEVTKVIRDIGGGDPERAVR